MFLESAGRPSVAADPKLEGAVGLTQILAETGRNLLGMRVDPAAARRLTRRIDRAERRGQTARADRLRARRRKVDQRFDPGASLRATARYLNLAKVRLGGRDDYAVAGYHMGIGNLQSVLGDYGEDPGSYTALYFGITPSSHPAAYRRLSGLGDDSATYLWRVKASERIMRRYREDRGALEREDELQRAKNSSEEVLHPEDETESFGTPDDLEAAYRDGQIRSFPNAPGRLGLRRDRQMGELARRLEQPRRLYRGLRPEAYALAAYMARLTRQAGGGRSPLTVTSTVRDREYQRVLIGPQPRGHPELLAAHHRLRVRRAAPLQRRAAGAGVPVRADPPPGAEPDRLGTRAGGDPHHRVRRRGPPGAAAQVIIPPNWPPVMFSTWPCT